VKDGRDAIQKLVDGFTRNRQRLHAAETNEATIRLEYVDGFWRALGWDVQNVAQRSPAEKDVVAEAAVATYEAARVRARRPDYLFRIGGFPRFIVEAKRPAVDLATDPEAIFQAKTYAWSARIPFAILTSFERFRLFDCTVKPYLREPDRGIVRDFDLAYTAYVAQWDEMLATFGQASVLDGSLERLLSKIKSVAPRRRIRAPDRMLVDLRGSEPVDRAFLAFLEDYRKRFATAIYEGNRAAFPDIETAHGAAKLTEAVQRLIDRFVFIRVCEDRNIAPWAELRETLDRVAREGSEPYAAFVAVFREFDRQFNGYLFKVDFTEDLRVPGDVLADFVRSLYPPESPYRFDAIGDDILAIIYERFLGNVVHVRKGRVEIEPKPEVRHAGGVYYTPRFVVDSIVRRVVGPKVHGRAPLDVLDVKILDPACGSGSFLVAAYQFLVNHCEAYVREHPDSAVVPATPKARKKTRRLAFQAKDGTWHLRPEFRSALLTSCIFGIDIDLQAVEVTAMSLYLKMLEGELPPHWQRDLLGSRLLPSLDNSVRCGNSLIDSEGFDRWWDQKHGGLFAGDDDTRFRLNRFDWNSRTRGFGRVIEERGGFDCIIGNPPYIRVQELNRWAPEECEYYKWRYEAARQGNYDIYVVFVERAMQLLARDGLLGFIMPHKYWQARYGAGLRGLISRGRHLRSVIDFTHEQVFTDATTYTAIHVMDRAGNGGPVDYARVTALTDGASQCEALDRGAAAVPGVARWKAPHPGPGDSAFLFVSSENKPVGEGVKVRPLSEVAQLSQGFKTGADRVFVVEIVSRGADFVVVRSREAGADYEIEPGCVRPLVKSEHMRRFELVSSDLGLLFPYEVAGDSWRILQPGEVKDHFPRLWAYLVSMRPALAKREQGRFDGDLFYQYSRQQNFVPLSKPKIISPDIAERPRMSWDATGRYVFSGGAAGGVAIAPRDGCAPMFLLGVLNSRWAEKFIRTHGTPFRGGYLNCEIRFLRDIPIAELESAPSRSTGARIAELAEAVVRIRERLQAASLGRRERETYEREAESHEARIDELVLRLYGIGREWLDG